MKLKAFLPLITYPDPMSETAIVNAVAVARHLGADVEATALEIAIPKVSSALSHALMNLPELIEDTKKLSEQRGAKLIAAARREAGAASVGIEAKVAKDQPGLIGDLAASLARYLDLVLVGVDPENSSTRMVAEAVIFGSGKPTILVPSAASADKLDHVAIAWDGSRAAARAVADARLVLERASVVTVITVTDEKPLREKHAGERLAQHLTALGVKAEFKAVEAEDGPIADTLQQEALDAGADILVMGGYGHSRLRDFVLGGATEGVLSDLKLPVLLSH